MRAIIQEHNKPGPIIIAEQSCANINELDEFLQRYGVYQTTAELRKAISWDQVHYCVTDWTIGAYTAGRRVNKRTRVKAKASP